MHVDSENRWCAANTQTKEKTREENLEHWLSEMSDMASLILKAGALLNQPSFHCVIGNTAPKYGTIKTETATEQEDKKKKKKRTILR